MLSRFSYSTADRVITSTTITKPTAASATAAAAAYWRVNTCTVSCTCQHCRMESSVIQTCPFLDAAAAYTRADDGGWRQFQDGIVFVNWNKLRLASSSLPISPHDDLLSPLSSSSSSSIHRHQVSASNDSSPQLTMMVAYTVRVIPTSQLRKETFICYYTRRVAGGSLIFWGHVQWCNNRPTACAAQQQQQHELIVFRAV